MPIISQFYGILIYLYKEIGGHHNEPHIHIKYNEYEMSMTLTGKIIAGKLPSKQRKRNTSRRIKCSMVCL